MAQIMAQALALLRGCNGGGDFERVYLIVGCPDIRRRTGALTAAQGLVAQPKSCYFFFNTILRKAVGTPGDKSETQSTCFSFRQPD